jgi:hypothetical protein
VVSVYARGRSRALQAVAGHVVHLAVKARRQPVLQARLGVREVDRGDADL